MTDSHISTGLGGPGNLVFAERASVPGLGQEIAAPPLLSLLHPDAAIHDPVADRLWTAADLLAEASARTTSLREFGVGPSRPVALVHDNTPEFFVDLLAVWSLGAAAACLDPALTSGEMARVIDYLGPAAICSAEGISRAGQDTKGQAADHGGSIDDPALILFTSGTTSDPKAVVLGHRAILARVGLNAMAIGPAMLSRSLVTLAVHFGHGLIGNCLTPLFGGGTIVLAPRGLSLASGLGALIDANEITFMTSVPAFWRMALKLSRPPRGSSLRRVHVGSAPLSAELWKRIADWTGCEVVNCFGMTETANWVGGASSLDGFDDGSVGRLWGGRAGIVGQEGTIVSAGEGEIAVLTPSVMNGYLGRPDLTRQAVTNGWYRTGDTGRVDESGRIWLTGRLKDEINRAGFKVQPAEVDAVMEAHPAVAEACTFGMADMASGEIVGIAVKLAPESGASVEMLRAWCAERMRREAVPEKWFVVDEIPRTTRGKLNRALVRATVAPATVAGRS